MFEKWPELIENKIDNKEIELLDNFFRVKDLIYFELEKARKQNIIKKNNEAKVVINFKTEIELDELKKWLNVAEISINMNLENIHIENANFKKCFRCWNHINDDSMFNDEICIRCNNCIN
jgi:isoleucyl-tRNA synthetase